MAQHGTLPEYMYQRQCIASDEPVVIAFDIMQDDKVSKSSDPTERDSEEEVEEFDPSSDEEVEAGSTDQNDAVFQAAEIGRSATFLLGARSSLGRAIRFNNRLVHKNFDQQLGCCNFVKIHVHVAQTPRDVLTCYNNLSFQRASALVSDFRGATCRVDSVCHPLPEFSYVLQLEALRLKDLLYQ